jgi:16S rRNA (guanine527-N7)-methyltransferase
MAREVVERWLAALLATPGLTAIRDPAEARRVHVEDALAALELVTAGPVVDVGSGAGSPGLPLAVARPELRFDLLEATGKKCAFLRRWAAELPNVEVVCARAEEHAAGEGRDAYATALARALAPPPVAVEWCLPLVRSGGRLVLYAGEEEGLAERVSAAAEQVAGRLAEVISVPGSERRLLVVVDKTGATPARFPRRPGAAKKRPLA